MRVLRHLANRWMARRRWLPLVLAACGCLGAANQADGQLNSYRYEWLYAGPRGTTVIAPPAGPGRLDPFAVWARFGFWPNPYLARQPIGHQTIATGPNGYVYRPVYADDETAASIALPEPPQGWAGAMRQNAAEATPERLRQAALLLFRAADYAGALDRLDRLLQAKPDDELARLLAVQADFALGDYPAAVELLAGALDAAPSREWDRYVRDYRQTFGSALTYLALLRSLERSTAAHGERAYERLLLAYEYGCLGFPERALALLAGVRGDLADRLRDHFTDEPPAPALDEDDAEQGDDGRPHEPPARGHQREF